MEFNWIHFQMETTQRPFLVQTDRVISEKKIRFTDGHQRTQEKKPIDLLYSSHWQT